MVRTIQRATVLLAGILLTQSCASSPAAGKEDVLQPPTVVQRVDPVYPPDLHQTRYEGTVVIGGIVPKEGGAMRNAHVIDSSDARFDEAALEAVSQWIWSPGLLNGEPVDVEFKATVRFALIRPN